MQRLAPLFTQTPPPPPHPTHPPPHTRTLEQHRYLFEGVQLTAREQADLAYKQRVYDLALERRKALEGLVDDGYSMPTNYGERKHLTREGGGAQWGDSVCECVISSLHRQQRVCGVTQGAWKVTCASRLSLGGCLHPRV